MFDLDGMRSHAINFDVARKHRRSLLAEDYKARGEER